MRVAKWDNAKFILIYCVVLGHMVNILDTNSSFLSSLQYFIYTFHMPAFLFISGLFSRRTIDGRRYERMLPYLFLYIFMKIFRFLVYSILNGKASNFDLFHESGVAWFGLTLFLCYLVTVVLGQFSRTYILILAVAVGMMAGYDKNLGDFLTGMRFFTLYPFFLMGYCFSLEKVTEITKKTSIKILSVIVLCGTMYVCFRYYGRLRGYLRFFKGKTSFADLGLLPWGGLYRGLYYILALLLVLCVLALVPSVDCVVTRWGSRSIQVFALHYPIITALQKVFHLQDVLHSIWPAHYGLLVPVVALGVTVILSLEIWQPFFRRLMNPINRKTQTVVK